MIDFLSSFYLWIKAFHIISMISWMAGIFYLPRLFVHHTEQVKMGSEIDQVFKMMEYKLLKVIMGPAMMATWVFGILLAVTPGVLDFSQFWVWLKLVCVILMTAFHVWLSKQQKNFSNGENNISGRTFRIMNEVPTALMIIIVISVVIKPF